jgi:hypothetical protein
VQSSVEVKIQLLGVERASGISLNWLRMFSPVWVAFVVVLELRMEAQSWRAAPFAPQTYSKQKERKKGEVNFNMCLFVCVFPKELVFSSLFFSF